MVKKRLRNLSNLGQYGIPHSHRTMEAKRLKVENANEDKENQPTQISPHSLLRNNGRPSSSSVLLHKLGVDTSRCNNGHGISTPPSLQSYVNIPPLSINIVELQTSLPWDCVENEEVSEDEEEEEIEKLHTQSEWWAMRKPPTLSKAIEALEHINRLLRPPAATNNNPTRAGYNETEITNPWTHTYLVEIRTALHLYVSDESTFKGDWTKATDQAAFVNLKARGHGKALRKRARQFIDKQTIPETRHKDSPSRYSILQTDEELASDINMFLQSCGKYVNAENVVEFMDQQHIQEKYGLTHGISKSTAQRWMKSLGYRWVHDFRGQYVDGHERDDVVEYRQKKFLPQWFAWESRMTSYEGNELKEIPPVLQEGDRQVVVWFHDESIFYAHDRRTSQWVSNDATPVPYAKGEGLSLMVADFVSAEFGWLRSRDGQRHARRIFRPGKNRDGWFDHTDILAQVSTAMDILEADFAEYDHIFAYDNAPSHLKRADDALSARRMPKYPSIAWGVDQKQRNSDGKVVYDLKGKAKKVKVPMTNGNFKDGTPQSLYWFPPWRNGEGIFKGMAVILEERGYVNTRRKLAQCSGFDCTPNVPECCCRRILYNEPDFVNVSSLLEELVQRRGTRFQVIILPKFHCELNPIEQCWGRAKFHYRLLPESSKEEILTRNTISSLEKVTIEEIRRFARRARRFMGVYQMGMNGKQAAWVTKKFRSHRSIPLQLLTQLDNAERVS